MAAKLNDIACELSCLEDNPDGLQNALDGLNILLEKIQKEIGRIAGAVEGQTAVRAEIQDLLQGANQTLAETT